MTVNTNGPVHVADEDGNFVPTTPYQRESLRLLNEIRDSQIRTEKLVEGFVSSMENNPMFATFGKMFGGKK